MMSQTRLSCFKAYDIRGRLGDELNETIAYNIGRATAQFLAAKTLVVGADVRLSSDALKAALVRGINDAGTDVVDIGLAGTEEVYFATFHLGVDGGIEVTASHNPMDYNGMKLVRAGAQPISGDSGLRDIQRLAEAGDFVESERQGTYQTVDILADYVDHLLSYVDVKQLQPTRIVVNSGNGAAGHVIDALERRFTELQVPVELIKVHHEPDGNFPHGIPNPLLPENRQDTIDAVIMHKADFAIAFDGDFDRCFFFDHEGTFIEGYYIVGLLAEAFLLQHKGAKVIHDPRLTWNTIDIVNASGGTAVQSKTGHAFIKERMRKEDAVYGGEMSAHHYFRDFAYCDSGMIPWLLVLGLLSQRQCSLQSLVIERMQAFPSSGEINRRVDDAAAVLARVFDHYQADAVLVDRTDGLSMEFTNWRFNLRSSNTEPVIRLNVESRADPNLMQAKTNALLQLIGGKN